MENSCQPCAQQSELKGDNSDIIVKCIWLYKYLPTPVHMYGQIQRTANIEFAIQCLGSLLTGQTSVNQSGRGNFMIIVIHVNWYHKG